jgi:hypothetical protein
MKALNLITAAFLLMGSAATHAAATTGGTHALTRISTETGVPVDTLQTQKSTTGLGYGDLEHANLLAKASGQSFDTIAGKFKAGEGWGEIAHDYGLNLGKIVSAAHQSSRATQHAPKFQGKSSMVHGKSSTVHGKSTAMHGKSSTVHGKGSTVHGKSSTVHGKSSMVHGKSSALHGKSTTMHGKSDGRFGNSQTMSGKSGGGVAQNTVRGRDGH